MEGKRVIQEFGLGSALQRNFKQWFGNKQLGNRLTSS
jgi:hypothetical protein